MTNSRASNRLVLLDHHKAAGTEATYTFTKTLDLVSKYREIIVLITGGATATLVMKMKITAQTDYNTSFLEADTTTVSSGVNDALTYIPLIHATLIDTANFAFQSETKIRASAIPHIITQTFASSPHEGIQLGASDTQATTGIITSIEILTSTSTWVVGTEITIYGVWR